MPEPRHLRIVNRERLKAQFQFEPRDAWVSLFWRVSDHPDCKILHLYVCLIPFLPLHISILREAQDA